MINGTGSNLKNRERMTYNGSGKSAGGRHSSSYSVSRGGDGSHHSHASGSNHHGGGHHQTHHMQSSNSNHHQNAMAAFMNQSALAAAALMHQNHQFAALAQAQANHRSGGNGGHHHQSSLNFFGFPPFPSASDPSIRPYSFHQSSSQNNAQSGHAPYPNSRMSSTNNNNTSSSSPPVTGSSSGNGPNSNGAPSTNGSTSCSGATGVVNSTTTTSMSAPVANDRANGGSAVTTNGNGSATPEGKSSLLSDHTDRSDHHHQNHHHRSSISKTNLYIRGLTPNTTDKDLHSLCSPYGNIISTKAILDKETNKCRGYGFVDFEHPMSAESAVKSLISQGVQAQMAKCSESSRHKFSLSKGSINEHDPTNLYIANLPMSMTESDLETMLSMHGSVISTRILKDSNGTPRGVGFARMESKEKCDAIINLLNGKMLPGSKDTLLVKFADGGSKKKHYKNSGDRYRSDVDLQMNFDSTNLATNGVPTQLLPSPLGAASAYQRATAFSATSPYQNALQAANPWLHQGPPQYIMQPQMIPSNMDPNTALQYSPLMHQLTAQMSHLQLGGVSGAGYMPSAAHAYGTQALYPQQLIQSMTLPGEQESINPSHSVSSGSASGEEQQQQQQHTFQQMGYNQLQK